MKSSDAQVDLRLDRNSHQFEPGDLLTGSFRVLNWQSLELRAVELSVLWHTAGKAGEDIGVVHFRRVPLDPVPETDIANPQLFRVSLPLAPLSYDGAIVKVQWLVRLRSFYLWSRELTHEVSFRLGNVPAAAPLSIGETTTADV